MNSLKIFNSSEFGEMRTYCDPKSGDVWFCLADVCKALDLTNPRKVKTTLTDRGLILLNVRELDNTVGTTDGTPTEENSTVTNSYGTPTEDLDSTLHSMEETPTKDLGGNPNMTFVNESGLYDVIFCSKSPKAIPFRKWIWSEVLFKDTVKGLLGNPDFMIKILEKLKAEKEENKRLQQIIDENKPKVDFANAALESVGSALTKELALWLQKDNRKDQH